MGLCRANAKDASASFAKARPSLAAQQCQRPGQQEKGTEVALAPSWAGWFDPTQQPKPKGSQMSDAPKIAQASPYAVEVEAGKTYFWCTCGQSDKQPFCDGSHKGSDFNPLKWEAPESKKVFFCGCKHTDKAPLCDGSHSKLG